MVRTPIHPRYVSLFLLFCDVLGMLSLLWVASFVRTGGWYGNRWEFFWPVLATLLSLYVVDAYRTDNQIAGLRAHMRVVVGVMLSLLLVSLVAYLGGYWGNLFGRGVLPTALLSFAIWAAFIRFIVTKWVRSREESVRWLVLGTGESAARLWKDFCDSKSNGEMRFLPTDDQESPKDFSHKLMAPMGTMNDLDSTSSRYSGIIITVSPPLPDNLVQKLMHIRFSGVPVYDVPDFYEHFWTKVPVLHLKGGWLVFSYAFDLTQNPLGLRLKRVLDVVVAAVLLVLLAPLMALVALLIPLESPGPAVYRQSRVGESKQVFTLYKFRSMHIDAENQGPQWASVSDNRITRLGRFLRASRLDELPQLWNVLSGDMSFIGPRPERPEFTKILEKQIPYYDSRHLVKPGITGWAQVLYPYGSSVDDAREKLQYDLYYIKHYSLLLDVAILFKTVRVVLLGRGR